MKNKNIRPEIKQYIDMGLRVPNYISLTPDEYHYMQKRCKHEKQIGGVCVACDKQISKRTDLSQDTGLSKEEEIGVK